MSTPRPPHPIHPLDSATAPLHLEQQRKLAKELLRAARSGSAEALARLRAVRTDAGEPARELKLADMQLVVAREAGFASWPKLVAGLKERDLEAFRDAVGRRDVPQVARLLAEPHVRAHVNDPMFDFGQRAAHVAAKDKALMTLLLDAGADLNLKSDWQNGPYTVLDRADEASARFLLSRGAKLTPNAAARLGWFEELAAMLRADPSLVHARGGDGQTPLHEAQTQAIADLLLERGADIDARCIDHKSTPAQYALAERPEVARHLLLRGATPDIFMAARLGDLALAERLLDADPAAASAQVHAPGYAPVPPFNIYCWSLGFGVSPHAVAKKYRHEAVFALLTARSSPSVLLRTALFANDAHRVRALVTSNPNLVSSLSRAEHGQLAQAIFHEAFDTANRMLDLGFDPTAPGVDGGTALHAACWMGNVRLVERILELGAVALDAPDPTHQSPPLGWAAYGSAQRRAPGGDYPAVAQCLVAAGANIRATGNLHGRTLVEMAKGNPDMQEALQRLDAV